MKKLYVTGIGPGCREDMTLRALKALEDSMLIVGYTGYVEILKEEFGDEAFISSKEFYTTGMTGETDRCRYALEKAHEGITTSIICSGDAGIYGMASPVLELSRDYPDVDIEIVPGITAASSGAALTGAPIGHDLAIISLSDRLTPWDVIEKRLRLAAQGAFVTVLYNPVSKGRPDGIKKAVSIFIEEGVSGDTPCALARKIGRSGENAEVTTLAKLPDADCDMYTTVFIGSDKTYEACGRMITPRGYR